MVLWLDGWMTTPGSAAGLHCTAGCWEALAPSLPPQALLPADGCGQLAGLAHWLDPDGLADWLDLRPLGEDGGFSQLDGPE